MVRNYSSNVQNEPQRRVDSRVAGLGYCGDGGGKRGGGCGRGALGGSFWDGHRESRRALNELAYSLVHQRGRVKRHLHGVRCLVRAPRHAAPAHRLDPGGRRDLIGHQTFRRQFDDPKPQHTDKVEAQVGQGSGRRLLRLLLSPLLEPLLLSPLLEPLLLKPLLQVIDMLRKRAAHRPRRAKHGRAG